MTARIYRYEVRVDGEPQAIELNGAPTHVGCRNPDVVEFWAIHRDGVPTRPRQFAVVGTGHVLPPEPWRLVGSAVAPGGQLVWHLLDVTP